MFQGKPAKFTPATRTTSSNSSVQVSKPDRDAKSKPQATKPTRSKTSNGTLSDGEDDSLEREMAMSSPMKGKDYRNSIQVCCALYPFEYTALLLDVGEAQKWQSKAKACCQPPS